MSIRLFVFAHYGKCAIRKIFQKDTSRTLGGILYTRHTLILLLGLVTRSRLTSPEYYFSSIKFNRVAAEINTPSTSRTSTQIQPSVLGYESPSSYVLQVLRQFTPLSMKMELLWMYYSI